MTSVNRSIKLNKIKVSSNKYRTKKNKFKSKSYRLIIASNRKESLLETNHKI